MFYTLVKNKCQWKNKIVIEQVVDQKRIDRASKPQFAVVITR